MTYEGSNPKSDVSSEMLPLPEFSLGLGRYEWDVIEMARHDGPRSLNPNGLLARVLWVLFRVRTKTALKNERLEALRRFSVRAWFWDYVRTKDMRTFLEAGFAWEDAWRILAHVAGERGFMPWIDVGDLTILELSLSPRPTAL